MRGRHAERGSIVTMVALFLAVLLVLALAAFSIGRVVIARHDAQRAADAAVVAAAQAYREEGRRMVPAASREVGMGSIHTAAYQTALSVLPAEEIDNRTHYRLQSQARLGMQLPTLLSGFINVNAESFAVGDQVVLDAKPNNPTADLSLVLDYSCSMAESIGSGSDRISALKQGVAMAMDEMRKKVRFNAVLFSSGVDDFRGFDATNEEIRKIIQAHGPTGGTMTNAGIDKSGDLFQREWTQNPASHDNAKFILLVSDGQPNDEAAARQAMQKLWEAEECKLRPTVFTLHIGSDGGAFMRGVSGPPCKCGVSPCQRDCAGGDCSANHYFQVSNGQDLVDTLRGIVRKLLCTSPAPTVAPLNVTTVMVNGQRVSPVRDEKTVRAFLSKGGGEQLLPRQEPGKLPDMPTRAGFAYVNGTLSFTDATCDELNSGGQVVLRYNHPRLALKAK